MVLVKAVPLHCSAALSSGRETLVSQTTAELHQTSALHPLPHSMRQSCSALETAAELSLNDLERVFYVSNTLRLYFKISLII